MHTSQSMLKVLSLHCCSFKSLEKIGRLQEQHKSVIIGCESHLDESYLTAEIFPRGYAINRKDHCSSKGGVF